MYYLEITKPVLAIAVHQLRRIVFGVDEDINSAMVKNWCGGFQGVLPLCNYGVGRESVISRCRYIGMPRFYVPLPLKTFT